MDFSVSSGFRSSSKKWMARCAAGVYADKTNLAYIVEGIILTVYRPQQVHVDSDHHRFLWPSIFYFRCIVVSNLIHPSVRDL